jgi:guanosine-3',5'-bis(diphosphate) 3'-pyrophosphohydrolase
MAAFLHDAIEDSEIPRRPDFRNVGDDDVASLVAEVTDDKSLPKATRKAKQVETAVAQGKRAR